jgi:hypothetical protein
LEKEAQQRRRSLVPSLPKTHFGEKKNLNLRPHGPAQLILRISDVMGSSDNKKEVYFDHSMVATLAKNSLSSK